jgi:hypothetical protein
VRSTEPSSAGMNPATENPATKVDSSQKRSALSMNVKSPSVSRLIGSVSKRSSGRIVTVITPHKIETTNYYEKREPEYKQRVVNGYKDGTRFAKRLGVRIVALDANGTIEQVHASILQTIKTSILI